MTNYKYTYSLLSNREEYIASVRPLTGLHKHRENNGIRGNGKAGSGACMFFSKASFRLVSSFSDVKPAPINPPH